MEEKVQKIIEELLEKIGVTATVNVEALEDSYQVRLDGEENALLIGKHGNTLTSIELIATLILAKEIGEFKRITIEIGDYRREREDYLKDLAGRLRDDVISTGYEKTVRGLKPWERRLVHMYLSEDSEVITESTGDDRDRVLVIKKK
jgi:spoIIIJ-associated protein